MFIWSALVGGVVILVWFFLFISSNKYDKQIDLLMIVGFWILIVSLLFSFIFSSGRREDHEVVNQACSLQMQREVQNELKIKVIVE